MRISALPIQLLPQHPRTPERDHSSGIKDQIIACGRVSAFPLVLVFDLEFPEAADEDVFAGFQGGFHDFQCGFGDLDGVGLGEVGVGVDLIDYVGFGGGHGGAPLSLLIASSRPVNHRASSGVLASFQA